MNSLKQIFAAHRTISLLVLAIVATATVGRLAFRDRHFQEVDSYIGYQILYDPLRTGLAYVSWSYHPQEWSTGKPQGEIRTNAAGRLVGMVPDAVLRILAHQQAFGRYYEKRRASLSLSRFPPSEPAAVRRFLKQSVEEDPRFYGMSLHGFYRIAEITAASHLPGFLQRAVMVPLGSTYPPGIGLFYAIVYAVTPDFNAFMSLGLVVTILVFSLSVISLYLTAVRLGVGGVAAAIAAILYLFSISLYSYAFHLSNVVWAIASIAFFFHALSLPASRERMLRVASLVAGGLVFFNYLVLVPYLAFIVLAWLDAIRGAQGLGGLARSSLRMLRSQWIGLLLILICGLIFVQPGQGIRAPAHSPGEFVTYLYFGALNFVAWFNVGGTVEQLLQLVLFLGLLLLGIVRLVAAAAKRDTPWLTTRNLLLATPLAFVVFDLAGQLNFIPTRHPLFLAPVLYLVAAFGLDAVIARLPRGETSRMAANCFVVILCVCGLWAQQLRFSQAEDLTRRIAVPPGVKGVVISDSGADVAWRHHLPLIDRLDDTGSAGLVVPGLYLYASETVPFAQFRESLAKSAPLLASRIVPVSQPLSLETPWRFTAFTPSFGDNRFAFMRPNAAYAATFRLN